MSNIVGIVNYGIAGNIHSIKKAVEKAGGTIKIVSTKDDFSNVDIIIIPGVGSFKDAMSELNKAGLIEMLRDNVEQKPTLGICLGMQILSSLGFEYGKTQGLDIIKAEVKPIVVDAKVPHMGFNTIDVIKTNKLLEGLENEEFYFMHSFEMVNYTNITSLTDYAGHKFVSSVQRDNTYGVQFHPEKSRYAGIELLKNFIKL